MNTSKYIINQPHHVRIRMFSGNDEMYIDVYQYMTSAGRWSMPLIRLSDKIYNMLLMGGYHPLDLEAFAEACFLASNHARIMVNKKFKHEKG
jgi:hypothetical protein